MIYNTDYDQVQTYTQTAWSGITGNKDLGIECASAMDCASGFCVDSVCCDTSLDNCSSDCEACNLVGYMGVCTVRAELDNTEVTPTCYYCNGTGDTSVAYTGTTGVNCETVNFCYSGICKATYCDEDNDSYYAEILAYCPSGRYSLTLGNDCNDSCATCYSGSTATTSSPDGKDQDCDGTVDDTACIASGYCVGGSASCAGFCAAKPDCTCGAGGPCYRSSDCSGTVPGSDWGGPCACATNCDPNCTGLSSFTSSRACSCTPNVYH